MLQCGWIAETYAKFKEPKWKGQVLYKYIFMRSRICKFIKTRGRWVGPREWKEGMLNKYEAFVCGDKNCYDKGASYALKLHWMILIFFSLKCCLCYLNFTSYFKYIKFDEFQNSSKALTNYNIDTPLCCLFRGTHPEVSLVLRDNSQKFSGAMNPSL